MRQMNDNIRPIHGSEEEQQCLPIVSFDVPSATEVEGLQKHQSLSSVYRWMLNDLGARIGGITDKQMATQLDMDSGYFSRVMQGQASFSQAKEQRFMAICGRGDPVFWRILKIGMDPTWLRPLESESERTIRELEEQVEQLQNEQRTLIRALKGEEVE